ncbi:MAG: hypothetical protein OK455_02365 [Thaumarchaeota archaeon]|nr:hypothetical protein [Nitrososphaerota archaeon]
MSSSEFQQTAILRSPDQVSATVMDFFKKATTRLDICAVTVKPDQPEPIEGQSKAYLDVKKRGGALRLLTDITKDNVSYIKEVVRQGTDVQHLSGIGGNFAISDNEYVAT